MSVSGNVVSVLPGAGGSFPVAGVRAKITRQRLYTSSGVWIAPANCYYVQLAMCGGGGSGAAFSDDSGAPLGFVAGGGSGAAVIVPGLIPVVPGISYAVTVGAGGASASATLTFANGVAGGTSIFAGALTYFAAGGGGAGQSGGAALGGTTAQVSSYSVFGVNGGAGGTAAGGTGGAVEHTIGGVGGFGVAGGGGASLFSAGGAAGLLTPSIKPKFGAGSGAGYNADAIATSAAGGDGVVILTWEE